MSEALQKVIYMYDRHPLAYQLRLMRRRHKSMHVIVRPQKFLAEKAGKDDRKNEEAESIKLYILSGGPLQALFLSSACPRFVLI